MNLSVTQMRHTLYYVNQAEQSYDPVGTAEFRLKGKNLIWTVAFPGSFDPTGGEITGSFFNLYTEEWASEFWPASKPLL